jgi:hypothetical protein
MGTAINGADAVDQFGCGEEAVGLSDLTLTMQPLGLSEPKLLHLL